MIPPAPPQDKRHRRHSPKTVRLVQQMYAAGWTPTQLQRYLADRGIEAAESTIRRWSIPVEAQGHLELNRRLMRDRRRRERAHQPQQPATATPLLDRMSQLRSVDVSYRAIAAIMGLDFGVPMSAEQARYYLKTRREPVQPKKRATR